MSWGPVENATVVHIPDFLARLPRTASGHPRSPLRQPPLTNPRSTNHKEALDDPERAYPARAYGQAATQRRDDGDRRRRSGRAVRRPDRAGRGVHRLRQVRLGHLAGHQLPAREDQRARLATASATTSAARCSRSSSCRDGSRTSGGSATTTPAPTSRSPTARSTCPTPRRPATSASSRATSPSSPRSVSRTPGRSEMQPPSEWIAAITEDLDAGASLVTLEARESGSSGICRPDGELRYGLLEDILHGGVGGRQAAHRGAQHRAAGPPDHQDRAEREPRQRPGRGGHRAGDAPPRAPLRHADRLRVIEHLR